MCVGVFVRECLRSHPPAQTLACAGVVCARTRRPAGGRKNACVCVCVFVSERARTGLLADGSDGVEHVARVSVEPQRLRAQHRAAVRPRSVRGSTYSGQAWSDTDHSPARVRAGGCLLRETGAWRAAAGCACWMSLEPVMLPSSPSESAP